MQIRFASILVLIALSAMSSFAAAPAGDRATFEGRLSTGESVKLGLSVQSCIGLSCMIHYEMDVNGVIESGAQTVDSVYFTIQEGEDWDAIIDQCESQDGYAGTLAKTLVAGQEVLACNVMNFGIWMSKTPFYLARYEGMLMDLPFCADGWIMPFCERTDLVELSVVDFAFGP